jgi:hypothetical protein
MGFGPKDLTEIEFSGEADIQMVQETVTCFPITIIRIKRVMKPGKDKKPELDGVVIHEDIPKKFVPILLETAGRKGSSCGGSSITGFLLKVRDTNDQPLAGAKVTVKQQDNQILASTLDSDGTVFVQGHNAGEPLDVDVEGFGLLGREGHVDPDDPDDGTLPEYNPDDGSTSGVVA